MKNTTAAVLACAVLATLPGVQAWAAGPYQVTGTGVSRDHSLVRTESRVQAARVFAGH